MHSNLIIISDRDFAIIPGIARAQILGHLASGPKRFAYCNFSGLDLAGIDFTGCDFDQCKLVKSRITLGYGTHWHSSDLTDADFSHGDFRKMYSVNCKVEGLEFFGCDFTWDCHFLSGLKSVRVSDGWRLVYWVSLVDNPFLAEVRALIPKEVLALLERDFERNPS